MAEPSQEEESILRIAAEEYETARFDFKIDKEKIALLVIDLVEAFVSPRGKWFLPGNLRIIPRVKKLIERCRELKIPVIYANTCFHPAGYDKGLMWDVPVNICKTHTLIEGTEGVKVYHEIAPKPEDIVVVKKRYSAFHDTNLDAILRGLGKDTLIICGCVTNYCCGHTARDAFSRDYKVIFGSDINVCDNQEVHEYELKTLRRGFALVINYDEIMKTLS